MNDFQNGKGMSIFVNGDLYKGHWKESKRHGEGVHYYSDGRVEERDYDRG